GLRERLTPFLVLAIQHLPLADFTHLSPSLIRSCSEIGSVSLLRLCHARGGDVNAFDGLPLYASVYNGNLEATRFLLGPDCRCETRFFGWKQRGFCVGLIVIEGFAMAMFSLLVGIWAIGMVQTLQGMGSPGDVVDSTTTGGVTETADTSAPVNRNAYEDGVTIGELTGMAVPSAVALAIMYRLVPFHKMCIAFLCVCWEQERRRREAIERRRADQEARGGV
ncbi:hypothetical protein HK101_004375, partial [Irineochytrium annulatum]